MCLCAHASPPHLVAWCCCARGRCAPLPQEGLGDGAGCVRRAEGRHCGEDLHATRPQVRGLVGGCVAHRPTPTPPHSVFGYPAPGLAPNATHVGPSPPSPLPGCHHRPALCSRPWEPPFPSRSVSHVGINVGVHCAGLRTSACGLAHLWDVCLGPPTPSSPCHARTGGCRTEWRGVGQLRVGAAHGCGVQRHHGVGAPGRRCRARLL